MARFQKTDRIDPKKAAKLVGDAFAIAHFAVANIIALLGEFTDLFIFMKEKNAGMAFVRHVLDAPVSFFLDPFLLHASDVGTMWMSFELLVIVASIIYGVICFLIVRFILTTFE